LTLSSREASATRPSQPDRPRLTAPLVVAFGIVLTAGVLHGIGTDRWRPSPELETAAGRLQSLPERAGNWQARPIEMDAEMLRRAGAEGHWLRRFTNSRSGASITIVLLCGRTGQMAVHRPEDCYRSAGYEMIGPAEPYLLPACSECGAAAFWTARFDKEASAGSLQLRIFWSWLADGRWQAPASPRLAFAGLPVLYKLYAVRETTGPEGSIEDDPCIDLLRQLIPELTNSLAPTEPPE
jgi:hypothetical protein